MDLPIFFVYQRDPDALFLSGVAAREHDAFMRHWRGLLDNPRVLARAILVRGALADDVLAGNVLSFDHEGRREVGYWLGREFWGKGFASAALAEFLQLERARPLYAGVATHNAASFRVLQKCGFRPSHELDTSTSGDSIKFLLFELLASAPGG